jgi:hypothetical protein
MPICVHGCRAVTASLLQTVHQYSRHWQDIVAALLFISMMHNLDQPFSPYYRVIVFYPGEFVLPLGTLRLQEQAGCPPLSQRQTLTPAVPASDSKRGVHSVVKHAVSGADSFRHMRSSLQPEQNLAQTPLCICSVHDAFAQM